MSGTVADRKRLIRVAESHRRSGRLSVAEHLDFFPPDSVGPGGAPVEIVLSPGGETVTPVIRRGGLGGRAAGRDWLSRFFERNAIRTGDVLALEKLGARRYRLTPFESKPVRDADWRRVLTLPLPGTGPTVLELFAGCGGMALGFKAAGYRTVLAVEWDAAACESLRANVTPRAANVAIQEIDEFPAADVIAGGPPCQGFSNLGERVPFDPRNQLWRHYMRAVEQVRPKAFVIENVPPLLASGEYAEIIRLAKSLGYGVESRVLNAADYGVPQTRKRAIVIGVRGAEPTFPEPTHSRDGVGLPKWRSVREAIGDLPAAPTEANWHIGRRPTAMSAKRYRCVPAGGNRFDLPRRLTPACWIRKTRGGTDLFGRLWWDRPSVTIRTEFYKPEKGRYLHPEAHRPITHREAARLQGFPDDFDFRGSRIAVGIQIGNACPPLLAEAIARHLIAHM